MNTDVSEEQAATALRFEVARTAPLNDHVPVQCDGQVNT